LHLQFAAINRLSLAGRKGQSQNTGHHSPRQSGKAGR
jgi:hypothetical protein